MECILGLSETARRLCFVVARLSRINNRHAIILEKKIHRRWFRACRHADARREPRKRQSGKPGNDRSFASRVPSIPDWWGASRAPPRCGPPPRRGRTARLVGPAAKSEGGGQSGVRLFAFAVGFRSARSASEAGEADVRPKRGEPIGHSCKRRWSEKRASDGRARPETGASTAHDRLDRVPVPWTPCMFAVRHVFDARSDALPRKTRPPRPSEPRGASRVSALPASATNAARRGPRARRAVRRDVPCVPRPSTQPEPVPFESQSELTSRGRCPARRVLAPAPRQIDASAGHLSEGRRTSRKDGVGKIRPSFGGPRSRIPRANQNRDLRKIFIAGGSLSHEPRMIPTAKI